MYTASMCGCTGYLWRPFTVLPHVRSTVWHLRRNLPFHLSTLYNPLNTRKTLLYCERGSHRIRRHDAQVRLLAGDLAKAARHPIVEERPLGRHRERPDIRALGRTGGTDLFDVPICHPLSQARIRDAVQNPLNILKAAWAAWCFERGCA